MSLKDPNSFEWKAVFGITGLTDLAQWGVDFIPVYGELVNEVSDPCIGIILGVYFQLRGISMIQRPSRLVSLVASDLAEQVSADIAPAWIIDAWYIHKTVIEEWSAQQAAVAEEETENDENAPANRMVGGVMMRKPPRVQPANKNNRRGPSGDIRPLPNTPTVAKTQKNKEKSFAA